MILFSEHLEDVNEQVDHVVVESNRTKYVVLITHLVLGVLAAVDWTSKIKKFTCEMAHATTKCIRLSSISENTYATIRRV